MGLYLQDDACMGEMQEDLFTYLRKENFGSLLSAILLLENHEI